MKLVKGFSSLLYVDPMDGGDVGDSDGALGTGFGLEDMLEDTGGRPEVLLVLPFRICCWF